MNRRIKTGWKICLSALTAACLAGCVTNAPTQFTTPSPTGAVATHCADAAAKMPAQIKSMNGLFAGTVARWGDKDQIIWRCGIDKPVALQATSPCAEVNGVGWFAEEQKSAWRFTTIGRDGYAEVTVPKKYAPEADVLVDLTEAARALPQIKPCQ